MAQEQNVHESSGRRQYVLRRWRHGFKIEELRADASFSPPAWVSFGFLPAFFRDREAARDYMIARPR